MYESNTVGTIMNVGGEKLHAGMDMMSKWRRQTCRSKWNI